MREFPVGAGLAAGSRCLGEDFSAAVMGSVDGWAVDPWIQLRVLGCQVGSKSVCWTFQAWMRGTTQKQ